MNVDEIFESYLMSEDNIPDGMVFGDSDAKAIVAGLVVMSVED